MSIAIAYKIRSNPTPKQDILLKISLRSLEKYGKSVGKVYMIGARRPWFSKALHVCNIIETEKYNKFSKVTEKMSTFCQMNIPFVLMNDDFILLSDWQADERIWYSNGTIGELHNKHTDNVYKGLIERTIERTKMGRDYPNHMTHTPFLVDFPQKIEAVKGLIGNAFFAQGYSFRQSMAFVRQPAKSSVLDMKEDPKIRNAYKQKQWTKVLQDKWMASFCPANINGELLLTLLRMFPEKSIYEI